MFQVQPGQTFRLVITGTPQRDFYTYAMFPGPGMKEGKRPNLRYQVPADAPLQPLKPVAESSAKAKKTPEETVYVHTRPFTWSHEVLVLSNAKPGEYSLAIPIRLMACNEDNCVGPDWYPPLKLSVQVVDPRQEIAAGVTGLVAAPWPGPLLAAVTPFPVEKVGKAKLSPELARRLRDSNPWMSSVAPDLDIQPPVTGEGDLGSLLLGAFVGAFLMLLTPCVFPMIPITVNFFLKQSEREHHNALLMACVYSGTIIVLLTAVMLSLGSVVIALANNAWFNLVMGGVLVFFALSLFGMYELQLPSGLARFTSSREGRGGYLAHCSWR